MNFLDMRTIVISYIISDGICAVVIGSLWVQDRRRFAGLGLWFAGSVAQFLAILLIALRGSVPDILSATGSNVLIVGGTISLYVGLEQFVGKPGRQIHNIFLLIVFALVHAYFLISFPNLNIRQIILSSGLLAVCSQCAWLMLHRVEVEMRSFTRNIGFTFLAVSLISLARIGVDVILPVSNDFFHPNFFDTSVIMAYQMLFIVLTLCLILLVNSRLRAALEHDILERARAAELLGQSEEKFAKAFQASPDGLILAEFESGKLVEINDGFENLFGYPREEVIGRTSLELNLYAKPEDRRRFIRILQEHGSMRDEEFRIRTKDGRERTVLVFAELVEINGKMHVVCINRDITERKQIEQELRDSEQRFRTLIESAPIAITIGREGRLLYANPMYARIHGFANTDGLIGMPTLERVAPASRPASLERSHRRSLGLPVEEQYEFIGLRKDGEEFPLIANVVQVKLDDGTANLGFFQDITERKRMEAQEQEQRALAEALRDTAEALNSSLKLDDILEKILDYVGRVIPYDAMTVTWIRDEQIQVVRSRGYNREQEKFLYEQRISVDETSAFTHIMETRQPLVIPDVRLFPHWELSPQIDWIRSHIKAPIIAGEKIAGVINLSSKMAGFFNSNHARILQTFANQAAIAVQNAMLYEKVQLLATTDELTGIYNRRGLLELCRREIGRLQRFGRPLSVLFVDIDHFKEFNDRYGYEIGDQVLRRVAETLQNNARDIDYVGRYGGEEMIILLPEISQTAALEIAERLRKEVEGLRLPSQRGKLKATVSIGVATLTPSRGQMAVINAEEQEKSLNNLIAKAGQALRVAKQQGRNQVITCEEMKSFART